MSELTAQAPTPSHAYLVARTHAIAARVIKKLHNALIEDQPVSVHLAAVQRVLDWVNPKLRNTLAGTFASDPAYVSL
jgi:hypothetical protein